MSGVTASEIFTAIRRTHKKAALVPEVVVNDFDYREAEADPKLRQLPQRRIDALMFHSLERTAILSSAGLQRATVPMWELEILNEGITQSRANFTDAEHMVRDYLNSVHDDTRGDTAILIYRYFGRDES